MGLYRIWLNPRGVGRHAIGRQYPAAKPYSVDIEAPSMEAAKKRANSSPLWTGEITTLRSGDTKRAGGGRAEREKSAWWATAPKDRRSDPLEVRIAGKWVTLSKMRPEALRSYQRRVVNELRRETRESGRRLFGSTSRYRFSLSHNIQPPEEFRKNVRAMSRELRKTAWHPKYKPGQYVLITGGEEGRSTRSPRDPARLHRRGVQVALPREGGARLRAREHDQGASAFAPAR